MREVARVLYGSQNYGLDTPESDRDYKVLMCPEFDDLYHGRKLEKAEMPYGCDYEHYSPMSIITFNNLLLKGNPNCIEKLFSVDITFTTDELKVYFNVARALYQEGYVALVMGEFCSALKGMALAPFGRKDITSKSVARAAYFYGLMNDTICKNGYRITERTWRNDSKYNQKVREIRRGGYDHEQLAKVAATIEDVFKPVRDAKLLTMEFISENKERARELRIMADAVNDEMHNVVSRAIRRELVYGKRGDAP